MKNLIIFLIIALAMPASAQVTQQIRDAKGRTSGVLVLGADSRVHIVNDSLASQIYVLNQLAQIQEVDDQALSLSGNTLTLEDGGTVDLAPYLDNTDDQQITAFSLDAATNVLTITLEDGGTKTVNLSGTVTGTKGSIFFADVDGNVTEDNVNLFWSIANKRLGLGTKSPSVDIEIKSQNSYLRKGILKFETGYNGVPEGGDYIPNKIWSEYWNNSQMEFWLGGNRNSGIPILKLGTLGDNSEFNGTVSGLDAVNADDFVTKSQLDASSGDNLGNGIATTDVDLGNYKLKSSKIQFGNNQGVSFSNHQGSHVAVIHPTGDIVSSAEMHSNGIQLNAISTNTTSAEIWNKSGIGLMSYTNKIAIHPTVGNSATNNYYKATGNTSYSSGTYRSDGQVLYIENVTTGSITITISGTTLWSDKMTSTTAITLSGLQVITFVFDEASDRFRITNRY